MDMLTHKTNSKFLNTVAVFIFMTLLVLTLRAGSQLLIPFVLAIVFCYIIITLTSVYESLKWPKWKIPHWLARTAAIGTVLLFVWLIVMIINSNIKELIDVWPFYQEKIKVLLGKFSHIWGIEKLDLPQLVNSLNLPGFFKGLASGIGTFLSYSGMVVVYIIFLLLEYRQFNKKLDNLFTHTKNLHHFQKILVKINSDAQTYIKIQSLISFLTGLLVYLVLLSFHIQFAAFWGMLTFILNFIPVIGSIVATLLPVTIAIVQLSSLPLILALTFLIGLIQVTLGNIILPRLMGKSLNLSPLVILLSLSFWGMVWDIPGMFLSIPIMVILNISLAQFESTRWLAVIFSGNGKID